LLARGRPPLWLRTAARTSPGYLFFELLRFVVFFAPFLAPFFEPFFAAIRSSSRKKVAHDELASTIQTPIHAVKESAAGRSPDFLCKIDFTISE
jgi:hypothetical protein